MTTEVAVVEPQTAVAVAGVPALTFTKDQVELIKRTVAHGTTDDELALFLYQSRKTGLDPLAGQIHCVKRRSGEEQKMSIQTAIDGYRLIADRTGKYAGNDDPVFDDETTPTKATVTVYKIVDGQRCPFTATARWSQYFPGEKQGFMWKKMPHLMLGKCAEALALRKAFPAELSGVYTNEEMEQAHSTTTEPRPELKEPTPKTIPVAEVISDAQGKRLYAIWKKAGKTDESVKAYLKAVYGIESTRQILKSDYDSVCHWAEANPEGDAQE